MQFTTGDGNVGGRYMMHCHNLVHEDNDMMIQFAVGDMNDNDPVTSDPPAGDAEDEQPVDLRARATRWEPDADADEAWPPASRRRWSSTARSPSR